MPESYRANAMRALQPVLDCIDEKGVVQQVSYGTPMGRESKDFYKQIPLHPMPYGQAMAILFLMEAEAQSDDKKWSSRLTFLAFVVLMVGLGSNDSLRGIFSTIFQEHFSLTTTQLG